MQLIQRPRRLRQNQVFRSLISETKADLSKIMLPVFVTDGKGVEKANPHLKTSYTHSVDKLVPYIKNLSAKGVKSFLVFGVSSKRDSKGSEALNPDSPVAIALSELREKVQDVVIGTDVALDPYTDAGHDGIFDGKKVLNDESVEALAKMSLLHAECGAHFVGPSDMMDGRILAIRQALDESSFEDVGTLSYTAKYASCFYGPFRDTLGSEVVGDKKTYQMDPANRREALKELSLDIDEGADMVMVKPASLYLDVISDFKSACDLPVAAYHVSGEAAMIELGAKNGVFDRDRAILETTTSMFRAGADIVVSYFAEDLARILKS